MMLFSNGAVAGALMGCKFGYKNLPEDLLNFPHRKWLDRKVHQFLKAIGLVEEQQHESDPHIEKLKEDTDGGDNDMDTSESPSDDVTAASNDVTRANDDVTRANDEQEDSHDKEKMTDNLHTGAIASTGAPDTIPPSTNPPTDVTSDDIITDDVISPSGDHTCSNTGPLTDNDDVTDQNAGTASCGEKQDM